jgi:hypothetical protein
MFFSMFSIIITTFIITRIILSIIARCEEGWQAERGDTMGWLEGFSSSAGDFFWI